MNDELTLKLVNALKSHEGKPSSSSGIVIQNLSIHINGDVHLSAVGKSGKRQGSESTRSRASRKELIEAIQRNGGRYFYNNRFSQVIEETFGINDLKVASTRLLELILKWSEDWHREIVIGSNH
jgi:hypothetical protein